MSFNGVCSDYLDFIRSDLHALLEWMGLDIRDERFRLHGGVRVVIGRAQRAGTRTRAAIAIAERIDIHGLHMPTTHGGAEAQRKLQVPRAVGECASQKLVAPFDK